MKVRQALKYLGLKPKAADQKRQYYKGRISFDKNKAYVRALMDADFIPYPITHEEILVDLVNYDHTIFEPDLISA